MARTNGLIDKPYLDLVYWAFVSMKEETNKLVGLVGFALIILQNVIITISNLSNMSTDDLGFAEYVYNTYIALEEPEFQYIIDFIGFAMFALYLYNNKSDEATSKRMAYLVGVWVVLRIIWQFFLLEFNLEDDSSLDGSVTIFLLSVLVISYALFMYYRKNNNIFMLIYMITNLVGSIMVFFDLNSAINLDLMDSTGGMFISYHMKLIFAPIFAVAAFSLQIKKDELLDKFLTK